MRIIRARPAPRFVVCAIALVAVALVFAGTRAFGFVEWDDQIHVYENRLVLESAPLGELLRTRTLGYPIPLTVLTYRVEYLLFGLRPAVFHATNVALHLACVALVFRIAGALGAGAFASLVAALLFGVHPAVAEPVSWVSGRKDLLSLAFALVSVLAAVQMPFDRRSARAWVPIASTLAAVLAKPVALYLVVLLPWLDVAARDRPRRVAFARALALAPIALVVAPIALAGQEAQHALAPLSPAAAARQVWYALGFHAGILGLLRVPSAKYLPPALLAFDVRVDAAPLVLAVVVALLFRRVARARRGVAGALVVWAALAYAPSSGIVPLTRFLADSYLYPVLPPLAILTGLAVGERSAVSPRAAWTHAAWVRPVVLAIGVAALATWTMHVSAKWATSLTLW